MLASELRDSLSEILTAMRYERAACALRAQRRLRDTLPCLERRGTRAQHFYVTILPAYQMHDQTEFLISPAATDPEVHWSAEHAAASPRNEAIAPSHSPRAGNKGVPHEITEDRRLSCYGLTGRGHRGGARVDEPSAPAGPTTNVVDADVSLVKPPPHPEQFWKRGHSVLPSLSEATHGLGIRR